MTTSSQYDLITSNSIAFSISMTNEDTGGLQYSRICFHPVLILYILIILFFIGFFGTKLSYFGFDIENEHSDGSF